MATFASLTLRHVLVFHRHGDRTPLLTCKGTRASPSIKEEKDFWAATVATRESLDLVRQAAKPVGADASKPPTFRPSKASQFPYGLLTHKGLQDMTTRGRTLRERYRDLLNENVQQEDVYVLSSNAPRAVESVQCLLRGFFHDEDDGGLLNRQVPQFYVHTYEQNVLAPQHPPQVFIEMELLVHDDVRKRRSQMEQDAIEKLALHLRACLGIPADQLLSWTALRDTLTCRQAHGWPFPDGVDRRIFEQIQAYDTWLWHCLYRRKDFCYDVFKDGVNEVYSFVKAVVEKKQRAKLSFFSAHDNSIVALVSALQIQVGLQLPQYGTTLAFEVYEDETTGHYFIAPRYENEVVSFAGHTQDSLCPFSHFESLALDFLHPNSTRKD